MASTHIELEPRVAKLETGLDILTKNVQDLTSVIRDQSASVERQLQTLTISVTNAAGPRKTDWQTMISAVMLIMAIGSAVFYPLSAAVSSNKQAVDKMAETIATHEKLTMHPVGEARLNYIEATLKDAVTFNAKAIADLDSKQLRETGLQIERYNSKLDILQKEIEEIKLNGSAGARERIAILETKIKTAEEVRESLRRDSKSP